jgi:hypothetical protein
MKNHIQIISAAIALSLLGGCATVVGEPDQTMTFTSSPSKAELVISDEQGREVFSGETPSTIALPKSDGTYFGGKTYRIAFSKTGYESQAISISAQPNGWYIGGNILLGGLIGWLIVDPWSGHMYTFGDGYVDANLRTRLAMQHSNGHRTLNIALVQELSPQEKAFLRPLTI